MREIVDFFACYSNAIPDYPWNPPLGYRAEYFDACLRMLPPDGQFRSLTDMCDYVGPAAYGLPSNDERTKLRALLASDATPLDLTAGDESPDWPVVVHEWRKALNRLTTDLDGSITSSRTLLETVCKHICSAREIEYQNDGDLVRLYKTTSRALDLAPSQSATASIRQILGGCAGIASGLAGLRNAFGDAHGKDQAHTSGELRHARLAVNAAATLATFLIETHRELPVATNTG
jgi:hypothetical protein